LAAAVKVAVGAGVGVTVFFGVALALKMEELDAVLRRLKRRKAA
jgi:hypothetical protein